MCLLRPLLFFLALLLPARGAGAAEELWTWFNADLYETDLNRFHIFAEQRMAQNRGSYLQVFSPQFKHRAHPYLELGTATTLLWIDPAGPTPMYIQTRPEFEANPLFLINDDWRFHMRNRLELRWNDFRGQVNVRTRHRLQFARRIRNLRPLRDFYLNAEFFFDHEIQTWTETRIIPAAISFEITRNLYLDLFYMVRTRNNRDDHITGTFLRWRL
jgi:hypothetical protein